MRVMRDHIAVARRFTGIETNTAYSFGLDDQEFVVAFDADDPAEFLDLVQELRATESSAYTESETPDLHLHLGLARARARRARRRGRARAGLPADALALRGVRAARRSCMSFTRGRPCGSPADLLGAVDRLPAGVGHVVGPALGEQLLERVAVGIGRVEQAAGLEVLQQRVHRLLGVALVGADDARWGRA